MTVKIDLQNDDGLDGIPSSDRFHQWVEAALQHDYSDLEQTIRIVDRDESRALNRQYRDRDSATNVLSFPAADLEGLPPDEPRLLGDVVVCASVVADEAAEQGKAVTDHWAHMIVHGTLHLLGFDHETDAEAAEMEALETRILASQSVTDPYAG